MRLPIIWTMVKKEVKDIFRDKKTIFTMIILPVLLYPILMVGMAQVMTMIESGMEDKRQLVAIENTVPQEFVQLLKADEQIDIIPIDAYETALLEEAVHVYIGYAIDAEEPFSVHYNAASDLSNETKSSVKDVFTTYEEQLIEERLEAEGLEADVILAPVSIDYTNHAPEEEMAGYFLAMLLPMVLIITIASSATYPAIDVMAGEKERGTVETLLTLPVSNTELIVGKFIAVATVALLSALMNLVSIGASTGLMFGVMGMTAEMMGEVTSGIDWGQFVLPIIVTVISVFLFTLVIVAISMSICAMAKSFKEAQNYMSPLIILVMLPAYAAMIPTLELTSTTASIPIVNVALLIKSVLMFEYDLGLMSLVLLSNLALVILTIFILVKLFDSEQVLFGSGKEFVILQRRYNIKKGTLPTSGDAMFIFAVALLALIYVGQLLQLKLGFIGIGASQGVFLLIVMLFAWYMKTDLRKTFSIQVPSIRQTIGAIILWMGTFCLVLVVSTLLMPVLDTDAETVEALSSLLTHENLWINLFVVALLPAICEEVLFRGIVYKGLENGGHGRRAVLVSAVLFGLMHMDLIRIPSTAILGLALAYVVYQTQSIFLPMLMHLLNNTLAVVSEHLPNEVLVWVEKNEWLQSLTLGEQLIGMTGVGTVLVVIGYLLLRNKWFKKQQKDLEKANEAL